MPAKTNKIFSSNTTKTIVNIVLVVAFFSIIKLLLLPSWHELNKNRIKSPEKISINNSSFESWVKSPDGNLLPEHFFYKNSPGALIERSDEAKEGKYSVLLKQAQDSGAFLRYQIIDFEKYKGAKIKLSAWIKSQQKSPAAIAIDIQDGVNPVNVKIYPNNAEWEKIELIGNIARNAESLLLTFKSFDNKNTLCFDGLVLQTIYSVEPLRLNKAFIAIIGILLLIIFYLIYLNKKYLFDQRNKILKYIFGSTIKLIRCLYGPAKKILKYLAGPISKIIEYFFCIANKLFKFFSKTPFLNYFRWFPITLFFIYFLYLCLIFYNKKIVMQDYPIMFDYLWYFYHRIQEGSFALWNPYSLLGRPAVQFNIVGISMFTPFLLFSEFTLRKLMITNVLGAFMAFLSIYLTGRILKYNKFYSLIPVVLFSAHIYFKSTVCSFVYTFLFFYPIAVAFLIYNLFKRKGISFLKLLVFTILLSISLTGCRLDFVIYALAFIMLIFLVFSLYQLPDKSKTWKTFSLGLAAVIITILVNSWHLSLLLNASFDNARVSIHFGITKLFDPLFIKWVIKDLLYQSSLLLCLLNILLYKVLQPEISTKKISFKGLFSLITMEFIILGLLMHIQPHFGIYYESVINNKYAILLFQFFTVFVILSIIYFWKNKINLGKTLLILASLFAGFYIAHQTLLSRLLILYDVRFYSRLFIRLFQTVPFLLIIMGAYSTAIVKKKSWFLTIIVTYLFIAETGPFFLNEILGIPWLSMRACMVTIPFVTILILEGISLLIKSTTILFKKIFKNLKYSGVKPAIRASVGAMCFTIALLTVKMVFVPSGIKDNNLVYYGGPPFAATTLAKEVTDNIVNNKPYEDSFMYDAYKNATLIRNKYGRGNHFKRVFLGNTIEGWSDHDYYKFLPVYSQTLNTVPIYTSSIPENLANIFNEIYNRKLTVHPEYDGSNRIFFEYKKEDCEKRNIAFNADYGSTVTIKPNLNYNNPLYAEILAQEGSKTPRVFLSDKVLIFASYMDEYKYLKNNVATQGFSLTNQITTSDDKLMQIIKNEDKPKLEYDLEFKKDDPEHIILDVVSNKEAYLALMDLYSKGWEVYIDGKKNHIYRGYIGTRFIVLKSGKHIVEFKYNAPFFKESLFVSSITWVILFFSGSYLFLIKKIKSNKQ